MSTNEIEVSLPSGGSWTFTTKLKWRVVRELGETSDPNKMLALMTKSWSFDDEPSPEAIDDLDMDDVIAALATFNEDVLPLLLSGQVKKLLNGLENNSMTTNAPPSTEISDSGEPTSEN